MGSFTAEQAEQILVMVDASAKIIASEERDDAFDEFAELVRRNKAVPGAGPTASDRSRADIVDASIFLGVGLTLLGMIASRALSVALDMAIEEGLTDALAFLRRRFRPDDPSSLKTITDEVAASPQISQQVTSPVVQQIVFIQIAAVLREDADDERSS
jgi:hypothetical protein